METLTIKKAEFKKALVSLKRAIDQYNRAISLLSCTDSCAYIFEDQTELMRTTRDSMIQRFEYCVDSLWKCLKIRLETVEKITLVVKSPRETFREACTARILNEQEVGLALEMLDARNATSHRYKEEQAELLAVKISQYYTLLQTIAQKL
jgi:nucleotidyltransferase substrate binding protein (TIGR01987 family)